MKRKYWIVAFISIILLVVPVVQGAEINIFPIGQIRIGEPLVIKGTTNLAVGNDLMVEVYSSSFKPTSKGMSGEFSGVTGTTKVVSGTYGVNTWSFPVDTASFKSGEYIAKVSGITVDVSASTTFTVIEYIPPTTVPLIGYIDITSQPSGAEIRIDGQPNGFTPMRVHFPGPGTYALELTLPGYKTYSESLSIQAGTPHDKVVYLEQEGGTPTTPLTPVTPITAVTHGIPGMGAFLSMLAICMVALLGKSKKK